MRKSFIFLSYIKRSIRSEKALIAYCKSIMLIARDFWGVFAHLSFSYLHIWSLFSSIIKNCYASLVYINKSKYKFTNFRT